MRSAGDRRRSSRKSRPPDPAPSQLCEDVKTEPSDGGTSEAPDVCVKKEETLELNISSHGDDLDTTPDVVCIKEEDPDSKDYLYCEVCESVFFNKCEVHGSPTSVPDTPVPMEVPDRARQSLPPGLEIQESGIPNAGLGVSIKEETVPVGAHSEASQEEPVDEEEDMNSEGSWMCPVMAEKRKRKTGDGCRRFKEKWSLNYFFVQSGEKALCVICNKTVAVMKEYNLRRHYQSNHQKKYAQLEGRVRAETFSKLQSQVTSYQSPSVSKSSNENESVTKASYKVAYILAKSGKPFTDGEVVKECLLQVAKELCPEKSKQFKNVALGANTIARRVADMGQNIVTQIAKNASKFRHFSIAMNESLDSCSTSQLLVFIRGVDEDMNITQELASLRSMSGTVNGEDIFNDLKKTFADYNLDWTNLSCLTVDGGNEMSGIKKGLVGQVKQMCNEKNIPQPMFLHCVIHQQALCAKYVDISSVLNPVVKIMNLIRSHGLKHKQFRDMLKDTDTQSQDLPYYTAVRWLCREKVLSRVFELRKEIGDFLESKGKPQPLLSDEEWVWKLAFAADITSHLHFLNLKLKGEKNLVSDLYTHLKAFRSKLVLFLEQVQANNLTHFQQCKVFMAEATAEFPTSFACEIIRDLQLQFQEWFSDLDSKAEEVRLFQNPFEADVASCPEDLQLEVIELQASDLLRDKFKEGPVGFYQFLPKEDFPNVKTFASRYLSIIGTTYLFEQTFSRMKYVKNNLRTNLSDDNLRPLLMLGTSNLKPEMSAILASKKQFHHSH